ncbi:MAG: conjugal transfer protein TraF [Campylobacterota bacterium]|nr:conjugal transfer protein TraF [Campylobacterota bacterium]
MRIDSKINLGLIIATLGFSSLGAVEFKPTGFKATGMGGVGVASSRGSLSGYYNPALLQLSDFTTEVSINTGVKIRESNLVDNMDKLSDIDYETTLDNIENNVITGKKSLIINGVVQIDTLGIGTSNKQEDRDNLITAIDILTKKIGSNNAFEVNLNPSIATQISNSFALGFYGDLSLGLQLNIDSKYDKLITKQNEIGYDEVYYEYDPDTDYYIGSIGDEAKSNYEATSLEYANNNGINYIQLDAVLLGEIPLSYARGYDFNSGNWNFGINAKYMTLATVSHRLDLGESSEEAEDEEYKEYETTYKPTLGIDLGLAYQPSDIEDFTIGLVTKNINSPKFKVDEVASRNDTGSKIGDYKIDPLIRAGVSKQYLDKSLEIALDIDLTKNKTIIDGEESQMLGAGIEYHPISWFAIRGGAMQDLASKKYDDGIIYTAGLGFGLKWLQVDLSAMMSSNQGTYDGEDIPRYASVNLSIVSKWGDGYNKKQP